MNLPLSKEAKDNLLRWIQNLSLVNGQYLVRDQPSLLIDGTQLCFLSCWTCPRVHFQRVNQFVAWYISSNRIKVQESQTMLHTTFLLAWWRSSTKTLPGECGSNGDSVQHQSNFALFEQYSKIGSFSAPPSKEIIFIAFQFHQG